MTVELSPTAKSSKVFDDECKPITRQAKSLTRNDVHILPAIFKRELAAQNQSSSQSIMCCCNPIESFSDAFNCNLNVGGARSAVPVCLSEDEDMEACVPLETETIDLGPDGSKTGKSFTPGLNELRKFPDAPGSFGVSYRIPSPLRRVNDKKINEKRKSMAEGKNCALPEKKNCFSFPKISVSNAADIRATIETEGASKATNDSEDTPKTSVLLIKSKESIRKALNEG